MFIYVFNKEDKDYLINKGFRCITELNLQNKSIWCFANSIDKIALFSKDDTEKFLFTNRAYFI